MEYDLDWIGLFAWKFYFKPDGTTIMDTADIRNPRDLIRSTVDLKG
jgi:hypothetical protein